jgi:hypothetical protein
MTHLCNPLNEAAMAQERITVMTLNNQQLKRLARQGDAVLLWQAWLCQPAADAVKDGTPQLLNCSRQRRQLSAAKLSIASNDI